MPRFLACLPALALSGTIASAALAGSHRCPGGAQLLGGDRCSDGSIPVYTADAVRPDASDPVGARGSGTVQPYQAGTAHPLTPGERQRMLENDQRAAQELARRWSPDGQPLNAAQIQAIENQRCLLMAAGNPDIRCAPR